VEIYRRIGERIRHARLQAGLTQPQLAQLLNVSKGIISRWETGLARPSLDRLEPLAARIGVSLEMMLGLAPTQEGAYRVRAVPVWKVTSTAFPALEPANSVGEILVSEEQALQVQAAFLMEDDSFCPYFFCGDVVGVQTAGRALLGDVVFVRLGSRVVLRHYGGRRKGEILLPMGGCLRVEKVDFLNFVGIFRWLQRPGSVLPRS
jgi:transcriptional regulator with XRE-family HTH domain